MTMTRCTLLGLAAGLPALSLVGLSKTSHDLTEVDRNTLSAQQWVEHVGHEIYDYARLLVNMERQAVRQTPWRT